MILIFEGGFEQKSSKGKNTKNPNVETKMGLFNPLEWSKLH